MGFLYLGSLLTATLCMLLIDFRYRLFFWRDAVAAWIISAIGVVLFIMWDVVGILFGIFRVGESRYATGWMLAPHFPVEELFFLIFFVICTMVIFTGTARILRALRSRRDGAL